MIGEQVTLILSELIETKSTSGALVKVWKDYGFIEGSLQPVSGREQFVDGKWRVRNDFRFFCDKQYAVAVDEKKKFRYPAQQREFDIVNVDDMAEQGMMLRIDLLERL
jgi:head-tail adaptor